MRIVHLTSVHDWRDTRIFHLMSRSLSSAGHEVHLIASAGVAEFDSGMVDGVHLHPVVRPKSRLTRMFSTAWRVFEIAKSINADIYHFHDPELLLFAHRFQQLLGKPFVYDVHEDYREKIYDKQWIPRILQRSVSSGFAGIEGGISGRLSGVVSATPHIAKYFAGHSASAVVQNFPPLSVAPPRDDIARRPIFVYVGGLSALRGIRELVAAVNLLPTEVELHLAGTWESSEFREECARLPGWKQVRDLGVIDRSAVFDLLRSALAGLVVLQPTKCYLDSYPIKMFEYMSAGLPIIASDFPLWKELLDGAGITVDPGSSIGIASAMSYLLRNPSECWRMGKKGERLVKSRFNWEVEFKKLESLYEHVQRAPVGKGSKGL